MPSFEASYPDLLAALADRYGPLEPAGASLDPFEALVATFLERVTDARKALAARNALQTDSLLNVQTLAESDTAEVVESLRAVGVKIPEKALAPLRRLARWLVDRHQGSTDTLADPDSEISTSRLRDELREINGIGPATAEALLLFAFRRPAYPVDRATYRVLVRHGWLDSSADFDEARSLVEARSPEDAETLAMLSGWFERLGRDHCRATVAKCERCPLAPFLPEGGPLDPSA